ncbi:MAG: SIMPL domain-containing protein [Thermomicrobiales bacterium]
MAPFASPRFALCSVGTLLIAVALLAAAPMAAKAQPFPGQDPGIVAVGFGEAAAPASSASLQFLVGSAAFFGGGFAGPVIEVPPAEGGEVAVSATPAAGQAVIGEPPPDAVFAGPPPLTSEQLDPIVDALVAAGATEAAITVTVPVLSSILFGPGGPDTGEIRVTVDQPEAEQLNDLVTVSTTAARDAGLAILHVGARYEAADCTALIQQARDAAVAAARERAEGLATAVGVTLGELVQASETPYFGPSGGGGCVAEGAPGEFFGPYGPGTDPPFDPTAEAEAEAYVQVSLTYAFGAATDATPSP